MSVKNKFENRSIFGEDMDKKLRLTFWATPYTYPNTSLFVAYPYIAQSEWQSAGDEALELVGLTCTTDRKSTWWSDFHMASRSVLGRRRGVGPASRGLVQSRYVDKFSTNNIIGCFTRRRYNVRPRLFPPFSSFPDEFLPRSSACRVLGTSSVSSQSPYSHTWHRPVSYTHLTLPTIYSV